MARPDILVRSPRTGSLPGGPDIGARGWRMAVQHTTTYRYSREVRASFNEVRAIPQNNQFQTVLEATVTTTPSAPLFRYRDYWGTEVLAFDIAGAHDLLQVRASAVVETLPRTDPPSASWDELARARSKLVELCLPSRFAAWDADLQEASSTLRRETPLETAQAIGEWVHESLEYAPGTTAVHTSALEVWRSRRGVCQDFTHLLIAVLRSVGIPARYVSGYLHNEDAAEVGEQTIGEGHAWAEAWVGGWRGIDPTNSTTVGRRHVVVAQGRDYSDVPPVKGIYAGAAEDELSVEVRLTRLL
jgi:transglutaminase-like putative cysteine protease